MLALCLVLRCALVSVFFSILFETFAVFRRDLVAAGAGFDRVETVNVGDGVAPIWLVVVKDDCCYIMCVDMNDLAAVSFVVGDFVEHQVV